MTSQKETISKRKLIFRYLILTIMTLALAGILTTEVWLNGAFINYTHLKPRFSSDSMWFSCDLEDILEIRKMGGIPITAIDSVGEAFRSGLRAGDFIVAVNEQKLTEVPQAFYRPFIGAREGDEVRYTFIRNGITRNCTIPLVDNFPKPRGYLGTYRRSPSDTTGGWKRDTTYGIRIVKVVENAPAEAAGLQAGDIIVGFNGGRVTNEQEFMWRYDATDAYQKVDIEVVREGVRQTLYASLGERPEYRVTLWNYIIEGSVAKVVWMRTLPWILFYFIFLIVGATIGWLRPRDATAFLCSLVLLASGLGAVLTNTYFLAALSYQVLSLLGCFTETAIGLALPLVLHAFARFPNRSRGGERLLRWRWVFYVYSFLYIITACTKWLTIIHGWKETWLILNPVAKILGNLNEWVMSPIVLVMVVLFVAQRIETRNKPQSRLKIIELGLILAIAGMSLYLLAPPVYDFLPTSWQATYYFAGLIFPIILYTALPLAFAYTILTRKIFDIRFIIRKGLRYILLSKGALLVEGIIVFLIVIQILSYAGTEFLNTPTAVGGVAVASTLAVIAFVGRVNRKLMPVIDRRFFREVLDVKRLLMELNEKLSEMREREKILQQTASTVLKALHPARVVMLLKEGKSTEFKSVLAIENEERKFQPFHHSKLGSESEQGSAQTLKLVQGDALLKADYAIISQMEEKKGWAIVYPETLDLEKDEDKRLSAVNCELLIGLRGSSGLIGVMGLGDKLSEEPYSKEDRELLLTVAHEMGMALENAELLEVAKREAEFSKELDIARQVQQNLFPKQLPTPSGWEFAGICKPAKAVGGDYYDIFEPVPGKVVVALGDVSGKGLGASFVMSGVHSTIRTQAKKIFDNPVEIIDELNEYLIGSTSKNIFVTLFLGIIDLETGRMRYVNCGHPPAFVVRKENGEIEKLTRTGLALGMMNTVQFTQGLSTLNVGDSLIVYSDGITEAMNSTEEMYEEERLTQLLTTTLGLDTSHMMEAILKSVSEFIGQAEQSDDVSIILTRRKLEKE